MQQLSEPRARPRIRKGSGNRSCSAVRSPRSASQISPTLGRMAAAAGFHGGGCGGFHGGIGGFHGGGFHGGGFHGGQVFTMAWRVCTMVSAVAGSSSAARFGSTDIPMAGITIRTMAITATANPTLPRPGTTVPILQAIILM